ncbi:MAG: CCA tRNA nucleotidyltransferase [Candidatus Margulisbacteria bacterium]|nr:CCA tRNA nucleotidyltransferase [Candidatus Margulisiibacteriota bacterium]
MFLKAKKLGEYLPQNVKDLAAVLAEKDFACFVVGGALRDILRGDSAKDIDLATDALPEQIEEIFPDSLPTGKAYGTITARFNGGHYQITTFRKETGYSDSRHPDAIVYTKDIREDVARRDFTINALAYSPAANELIDEFNGLEDLRNKILRTVGDPARRFTEDGLRVLRALRFLATLSVQADPEKNTAAENFTLEENTAREVAARLPDFLDLAAKERIFEELNKMLLSDAPDNGAALLGWPALNELDKQVRWAAVVREHPEVRTVILEKKLNRWIDKLLRYDLDVDKASLEIADLKVDGIDIMGLGPRGAEVGRVLETLLEVVVEKRSLNKKLLLLELARDIMAGAAAQDILRREQEKKALAKSPLAL